MHQHTGTRAACDCRYTANHAAVSDSFHFYNDVITQWERAAGDTATHQQRDDAMGGIALNLQNLPNFERATAIGLAEALLRHFADTRNLCDFRATGENPADCPDCGGDGIIPAIGRGAYIPCPTCATH